jgi:hypothetical protein
MFGGHEDTQVQQANGAVDAPGAPVADAALALPDPTSLPAQPQQPIAAPTTAPAIVPTPVDDGGDDEGNEPVDDQQDQVPQQIGTVPEPQMADNTDDLMNIKQQALQQLSPLLGHLDQTPEERFRTTMMMIQASDDNALLKPAYDAALQIPDDKTRAQALLDVVNEINYFTQHGNFTENQSQQ